MLDELATRTTKTRVAWIKAHIGLEGNEEADLYAKEAANNPTIQQDIPLPWGERKQQIQEIFIAKWKKLWDEVHDHRNSKFFFKGPDKNKAKGILNLSRGNLTVLIRALTNHNFLGYHQHKTNHNISKCCRFCEEEYKIFHHLLTECPALHLSRQEIFLDKSPIENDSWSIKKILKFLHLPPILNAMTTKDGLTLIDEYDTDDSQNSAAYYSDPKQ